MLQHSAVAYSRFTDRLLCGYPLQPRCAIRGIFRAQGMHLGSGIAEAACKTIVSTRAKRSGMRWTPEGLDALLPVRTAVLNGAYDSLWQQEHAA